MWHKVFFLLLLFISIVKKKQKQADCSFRVRLKQSLYLTSVMTTPPRIHQLVPQTWAYPNPTDFGVSLTIRLHTYMAPHTQLFMFVQSTYQLYPLLHSSTCSHHLGLLPRSGPTPLVTSYPYQSMYISLHEVCGDFTQGIRLYTTYTNYTRWRASQPIVYYLQYNSLILPTITISMRLSRTNYITTNYQTNYSLDNSLGLRN